MQAPSRWFLILLALFFGTAPIFAARQTAEERAFSIALEKFQTSPDLSLQDFADFIHKYPNSVHVPEAILYQARAMLFSGEATSAINLLSTNQPGSQAPEFAYWLGRARFQNKDYPGAADAFDLVWQKFPDSPQILDAVVREADAFAHLERWPRVVQLLERTNGIFQTAVRKGAPSETVASGYLLLGEAQLAQGNSAAVESVLHALEKQPLSTRLRWRRDYLEARVQRAENRLDDALHSANILVLTEDRTNRAEGVSFQAGILEQLGNLEAAANAYTNNLASGVPPDQQREAILKIAELNLKQNTPASLNLVVQSLTSYLALFPPPEATDLATLTLGQVRLKQAAAGQTNLYPEALADFSRLTNGPYVGKALLEKGWCLWNIGKIAESQQAFREAAAQLPFSEDQAEARFKWADTQFALGDFAAAVTNYNSIAEKYASLPGVKQHDWIERALYQSARAALNETNMVAANSAVKNILQWFPNGLAGPKVLLLTGQEEKDPAAARQLFADFETRYPNSELLPEVRLAIARSYEQERNWDGAITNYSAWAEVYPHHPLVPVADFSLAWDQYMAGRETNALMLFTNFIVRFPTNELSARAQFWVGDFYFRQGDSIAAEKNYQLVYQNTNWPASDLTYEARMRAGMSAMARYDYRQAIGYFTNLMTPDCPRPLQVRATMAFADAMISQDSTNKTADLNEAIQSLKTILQSQPGTWEAAQAWGKIGDCYFNLGATDPGQFTNAEYAYGMVADAAAARSSARNEARFNLAMTTEKQAALKTGDEQTALLKRALDQYVDAFYKGLNDPEGASPFWAKKAGLQAAQLAESLQQWQVALKLYERLKELLPVLAPTCEKKIAKAIEHGAQP